MYELEYYDLSNNHIAPRNILIAIYIVGVSTVGKGNGTDLSITVHVGQNLAKKIFEAQIWNEHSKLSKAMVESSKLVRKVSAANMKNYCDSQYSIDDDLLIYPSVFRNFHRFPNARF